ncbi:ribonuclease E/G-like protein, chloroplastic [Quillaja saponaria]|uniref:Ribonuclease E/G-like protein, chloroplastic n=1 Tax=Quillaja saponaria TaxID=32244 RepID=A0AAD7LUW0_QUISA|nr:ribonuclease E/G-like protein, chloroplastic [Quillaja saponaria]
MSLLAYSTVTTELVLATGFMEVLAEARCLPHQQHLRRRSHFTCPWLLPSQRFLSPHICRPLHDIFRFTLCIESCKSFRRSPTVSIAKGKSTAIVEQLCEVVWIIEADLAAGQLLYITGEPAILGCWKPKMATVMSPTEHANLWKVEVKIAYGVNFKYNYFIKGKSWSSCDIIWRVGPVFSLSVPRPVQHETKILVRDSWIRSSPKMGSAHAWSLWTEETYLLLQPFISAPDGDEVKIEKHIEGDLVKSEPLGVEAEVYSNNEDRVNATDKDSTKFFSERYQPVEEPWLLFTPLFPELKDKIECGISKTDGPMNEVKLDEVEKLLPEESCDVISKDPVSTTILINSSICTMQRIAVLEDEKLVELLLEPVKNNVQCDSVYIGEVTKLVPHMGGAFVNIGNSRPSLMDIKQNREPFIFPPFRQKAKKKEFDVSVTDVFKEFPVSQKNEHTSNVIEDADETTNLHSRDGFVQSMQNDYDDHDGEEDFDISEVLKENVNGSMVDDGEVEADFEDDLDGIEVHPEGETHNGVLPITINGSMNHQISRIQDMKELTHTSAGGNKWIQVRKRTKIIVQVVKEGLGSKGPTLTAYPKLRSRFWVLITRCNRIGVSKKISGVERTRLKVIAKTLQPEGFGLTVRTVAAGHSLEELQKDLEGLLSTWKNIMEHAKSAALAADEGAEGAIPVILHTAMGQTLSVVQDYFNEKVKKMVVDSARTYHEVTNYLQEIAPNLYDRVQLYDKRIPLFDEFNIEGEIDNILSKRVSLANGGSLVIEQTEALVSIDVNGGHGMLGHGTSQSQEKAILDVNLAAAKQIARELRLRDIGGIIVVDFIDMTDESNKRLVYEEVKKAVERDRSMVKVSELSRHGLMEITRKRVRPSVTFMISEPCACCHATGRVEALETSFSKIEQQIRRLLATMDQKANPDNPKSWPKFILKVDHHMSNYLTSGKKTRLAILSSSLKVWIILKVARGFTRGSFEVKLFTDDKAEKKQHQVPISILRPAKARPNNPGQHVTLFPVKKSKTRGK